MFGKSHLAQPAARGQRIVELACLRPGHIYASGPAGVLSQTDGGPPG